jgi:hypothetical protein
VGAPSNVAPSTLQPLLRQAAADVLVRLYPAAKAVLGQAGASATAGAMAHATATPVTATSTSQAMPPANAA